MPLQFSNTSTYATFSLNGITVQKIHEFELLAEFWPNIDPETDI
jgi:hypothetical protein